MDVALRQIRVDEEEDADAAREAASMAHWRASKRGDEIEPADAAHTRRGECCREILGDAEDGGDNLGQLPKLVRVSFAKSAGADAMVGAYAFLVFVLTYTPCLATVAEQARQIGARRAASAVGVQLVTAWILAVVVFQIGRLIW